ncbi:MAG: type II toxin-antitoxin system VapC family toxin [Aggregatilineales bacterium]
MPAWYLDSSALVKRYIREAGSKWIASVTGDAGNDIYLARLTGVEVTATIARRTKPNVAARQIKRFRSDFNAGYIVIAMTVAHFDLAMNLAEKHRLRAADALQLAVALDVVRVMRAPLTFVAADAELLGAARAEGLAIDNPNNYS